MSSCGKIETIIDAVKVTGAKGGLCPGSFTSTGANAPVAPVESAPFLQTLCTDPDWYTAYFSLLSRAGF